MKTLKTIVAELLQRALGRILGTYNATEHENRLELVGRFVYEFLPALEERFAGKLVVEGGRFNYFELPSGDLPRFDFVIPQEHLYVVVGDIRSASWDEARLRGISRPDWEAYQADFSEIVVQTPKLPALPNTPRPRLLFIGWNDACSGPALAARLRKAYKGDQE